MQKGREDSSYSEFKFGYGLGDISFEMSERDLFSLLGKPDNIDIDVYEKDIEETKRYHYPKIGLMIAISMYEGINEPLRIFPKKLFVDGVNLYDFNFNDLLEFVKKLHKKYNIEHLLESGKESFEDVLIYPKLGLTIWFDGGRLLDICMEKPIL